MCHSEQARVGSPARHDLDRIVRGCVAQSLCKPDPPCWGNRLLARRAQRGFDRLVLHRHEVISLAEVTGPRDSDGAPRECGTRFLASLEKQTAASSPRLAYPVLRRQHLRRLLQRTAIGDVGVRRGARLRPAGDAYSPAWFNQSNPGPVRRRPSFTGCIHPSARFHSRRTPEQDGVVSDIAVLATEVRP
jgi:hypothetical protein